MHDRVLEFILTMYPPEIFVASFRSLVDDIRPGIWNRVVPIGSTPNDAANQLVALAVREGWVRDLFDRIQQDSLGNPVQRAGIVAELKAQVVPTIGNPLREVLLAGNRPFAGRPELRRSLQTLCDLPGGPPLLRIRGNPQTGKSFSFYLAQHIAHVKGLVPHLFEMGKLTFPDQLAGSILQRIGADVEPDPIGLESAERWAEKLADQVADAVMKLGQPRLFVFDAFPNDPNQPPLPPETISVVARLARYADEELKAKLRVVTVLFPGEFHPNVLDVAEDDEAKPFTSTDMLDVVRQVVNGRGWNVSDQAIFQEIQQSEGRSLRERFRIMRQMLQKLEQANAALGS